MDKFVMDGHLRDSAQAGSRSARKLRAEGLMPVNVYGASKPNAAISVNSAAFSKALQEDHKFFEFNVDGTSESGLLKEVQYDTFSDVGIHADIYRVKPDDVVETTMHIVSIGVPKGVSAGGTLDIAYRHVPVRGKVSQLNSSLSVNVEHMAANESIRAKDLELPEGVELLLSDGTPVIIVHGRRGG
ncbi:MAG: 50S ribosomal protein L25 [Planctomycetota bacterium]